jgi:hypothetical protein
MTIRTRYEEVDMAAGATHRLHFRLRPRGADEVAPHHDRAFDTWRASIWTAAAIGTAAFATTVVNVVAGPADEIVMASAFTLTGVLGQMAPIAE